MAVVPPRQVAVLSIANYDELCEAGGPEAGEAALALLRELAIGCGVDAGYMRQLDGTALLLRLDELPREGFLDTIKCLSARARKLSVPTMPEFALTVRVGAMSERCALSSTTPRATCSPI